MNGKNFGNRKSESERPLNDFYQTPKCMTWELLKTGYLDSHNIKKILDPCAGSFTTGIACKEMNRNCIGVEINKAYYERALKRIRGQNDKGTPQGAASGSPRGENK